MNEPALEAARIITKSVGGARFSDPEVLSLTDLLPKESLASLLSTISALPQINELVAPIHELAAVRAVMERVVGKWDVFDDPAELWNEFSESHACPTGYLAKLGIQECGYVRPGIVADCLLALMRTASGKKQYFGNAGLIKHLDGQSADHVKQNALEAVARQLGIKQVAWRSGTTVSYGFRDWMFGDTRQNFSLTEFDLLRVAETISAQAGGFSKGMVRAAADHVIVDWIDELVENKVGAYREYRPLDALVEVELGALGGTFSRVNYFPSIWHEKAIADGERINARAGTTTVYLAGSALIKTQSVSDAGAAHKKKELMARAFSLRYKMNCGLPVERKIRLFLVVDGTFSDQDLIQLTASGWDEIFYPDEMDKLAKAIA